MKAIMQWLPNLLQPSSQAIMTEYIKEGELNFDTRLDEWGIFWILAQILGIKLDVELEIFDSYEKPLNNACIDTRS